MFRNTGGFAAICAGAMMAPASPAQAQDRDNGSDVIVVEGQREVTVRELRNQARSITPRAGAQGQPLARMHQEVCVGVWGLAPESAQLVIDRIYYNAEMIGLPVAEEEGCTANIVVAIIEDPQAEFAAMRDEGHHLVSGLDLWERKRVVRENTGPVMAWNVIAQVNNNSQPVIGDPPTFDSTMISRTMTSTTREIAVSVIFIDRDHIADIDGVAVADYATMRSLARTRPPIEETSVSTVLSLFDDDTAPLRLTAFDRAYLGGLYDSPANRPMRMAMGTIGSRLEEELAREE